MSGPGNGWAGIFIAVVIAFARASGEDTTDRALLERLASELAAAAPSAKPDDSAAYALASRKLSESKLLESVSGDSVLWGARPEGKPLDPSQNKLSEFDPRVWRVEYLPEFMFPGGHAIQRVDSYTVLAMDCNFRNAMDPGDYPYPFWHSIAKWRSYQLTKQVLLVFEKGKLIAGYRSSEEDPSRPTVARTFDGIWQWSGKENRLEPHVSLYTNLFSKENPHVANLDSAYRSLESASRQANCMSCHSPDSKADAKRLIMLNYPNQALAARRTLVKQLESNAMPPEDKDLKTAAGIGDAKQKEKLVTLARVFVEAADKALAFEKKNVLEK